MATTVAAKKAYVFWQDQEDGIPNQAILINVLSDSILLEQGNDTINLDYDSLNEFIKILKTAKDERPK
ncbi:MULTISPECIES: hypothetical protein [unclassified Paraflavitalea]|uniref:hypothetical protein n=1 Tax=unclassified Paraflavitalea TaxID=2798305 RepID=UPI003D324E91